MELRIPAIMGLCLLVGPSQALTMEAICSDRTLVSYVEQFVRMFVRQCSGYDLLDRGWSLCQADERWFDCEGLGKYISIIPSCPFCDTRRDPTPCYRNQLGATTCARHTAPFLVTRHQACPSYTCSVEDGACVLKTSQDSKQNAPVPSREATGGMTVGGAIGLVTLGLCIGAFAAAVVCVFFPTTHSKVSGCVKESRFKKKPPIPGGNRSQLPPVDESSPSCGGPPLPVLAELNEVPSGSHKPSPVANKYESPSSLQSLKSHKYSHLDQSLPSSPIDQVSKEHPLEPVTHFPDSGEYVSIENIEAISQHMQPIKDDVMDNPDYQPIPEGLNGPMANVLITKQNVQPISDEEMNSQDYQPIPEDPNGPIIIDVISEDGNQRMNDSRMQQKICSNPNESTKKNDTDEKCILSNNSEKSSGKELDASNGHSLYENYPFKDQLKGGNKEYESYSPDTLAMADQDYDTCSPSDDDETSNRSSGHSYFILTKDEDKSCADV